MDGDAEIAQAVAAALPDEASSSVTVLWKKKMGFSGACVAEVSIGERRVIFKRNPLQTLLLKDGASNAERLRAERTDASFSNELVFLAETDLIESLAARGVGIPRPLHTSRTPTGCTVVMESLSRDWEQLFVVPAGLPTTAALRWLARFHAAFLPAACGGGGLPVHLEGGFGEGTHLALSKRPASELDELPQTLGAFCDVFGAIDPFWRRGESRLQGERLRAVAPSIARFLGPGGRRTTRIHGDAKSANLFFSADGGSVRVIDWQWSGRGNALTDVVYLMAMALQDVADWRGVVREYHTLLAEELGSASAYPLVDVMRDFKLALLDFHRWQSGARLRGFTPEKLEARAATPNINHGIYLRDVARQRWVWELAEEFLGEIKDLLGEVDDEGKVQ